MDATSRQVYLVNSNFLDDLSILLSEKSGEFGDMNDDFGAFDWPDNFNDMTNPEY